MIVNIQDDILRLHLMGLLGRLLQDKATKGSILWATDAYSHFGDWYTPGNEIRPQRITGENSDLIKTRARRAMEQRTERTRQHAEVFTPLWIVKKMNDTADVEWFGRKDGFYKLTDEGKIAFTNKQKHWKLYVDARRLEITCGEAPFLVTRYDVETGEALPIEDRIGLLDRKLRVVSENAADIDEWKTWALRAVQAIYGFELQGDNLLIARVNVLCSVEEHMMHRWRQKPDKAWLEKLCNVISWNLWQMDGIKGCVPVPPQPTEEQLCLFPPEPQFGLENLFGEKEEKEIGCRLFDWRRGGNGRSISYKALREKGPELMKFDFIIGNPPYQEENENNGRQSPIYNLFMEEAYRIGECVELITPARFLFDAGQTPKAWNEKMLNDTHLKVLSYESDASKVFPNTEIKGGVVVTLRDEHKNFGEIGIYTEYEELNGILHKVLPFCETSVTDICVRGVPYGYTDLLKIEHPEYVSLAGNSFDLRTNAFENLYGKIFFEEKQEFDDVPIYGMYRKKRRILYIASKYLRTPNNFENYKVILSKAQGADKFGEALSDIIIGEKKTGHTQTFFSMGNFVSENDALHFRKYLKTKFVRCMLSVLKKTQDITAYKWKYVPLQDFTPSSDIDWSKSIPEIDKQLYAKYGLDEAEIAFIETHVKEMN